MNHSLCCNLYSLLDIFLRNFYQTNLLDILKQTILSFFQLFHRIKIRKTLMITIKKKHIVIIYVASVILSIAVLRWKNTFLDFEDTEFFWLTHGSCFNFPAETLKHSMMIYIFFESLLTFLALISFVPLITVKTCSHDVALTILAILRTLGRAVNTVITRFDAACQSIA